MASIRKLEDFTEFIEMGLNSPTGVTSPSPVMMREMVRDRLQVVERQMRILARRLDISSQEPHNWWSSDDTPPDQDFCESWSGLMYLSNTRDQLIQTLRHLP